MPRIIRKFYDVLVRKDEVLQILIAELDSDVYRQAIMRTSQIQNRPDPMSGLNPSEYSQLPHHKNAFIFRIPTSRA